VQTYIVLETWNKYIRPQGSFPVVNHYCSRLRTHSLSSPCVRDR